MIRSPPVHPTNFKIRIFGKNPKKFEKIGFLDRSEAAKFETWGSNDRNSKITIEFGMEAEALEMKVIFLGLDGVVVNVGPMDSLRQRCNSARNQQTPFGQCPTAGSEKQA